jgi:proteasome lid subunit RPN8/RPN11
MAVKKSRHPVQFKLPLTDSGFERITANGMISADSLLVFLAQDVYDLIKTQSKEHDPREIGGVLLGQYCQDEETRFVIVPTAVPCELGEATPVSIDFPPEFWQHVEEVQSSDYPGLLRIGPYHSHPGYGIHPSTTDQGTILRTFSYPHNIGLIYDPRDDQIGFTCWRNEDLVSPSGCFIYEHHQNDVLVKALMEARPE